MSLNKKEKMNTEIIAEKLQNLLDWEESDKDTYQLEKELLETVSHLRTNDFVKVIVENEIYIVFVTAFQEEDFENKAYYYSKLQTNIPLESTNELFNSFPQLLNN